MQLNADDAKEAQDFYSKLFDWHMDANNPMKYGMVDSHTENGINAFVGEKDTWCLTDAPNSDAVHKGHESIGINLGPGNVPEVQALV